MIIINKVLNVLHKINKFFITIFAILGSIILGMALIAFVRLSKIALNVELLYKSNVHLMNIIILAIVFIPTITIIFEKVLKNHYSKVR